MDAPACCWFVRPLGCSLPLSHQALETGPQFLLNRIGVGSEVGQGERKLPFLIHSFLSSCPRSITSTLKSFKLDLSYFPLTMP